VAGIGRSPSADVLPMASSAHSPKRDRRFERPKPTWADSQAPEPELLTNRAAARTVGKQRREKLCSSCMTVKIGVILPTSTPDPAKPILGDIRASARLAEDAGLDSVWSTDHLVASAPILDSTVALATAAAVTERITIGFGVMLLALRPVSWAAKQISTLQYVSGNRIAPGVGTGNPAHGDIGWRAAGMPYRTRGERIWPAGPSRDRGHGHRARKWRPSGTERASTSKFAATCRNRKMPNSRSVSCTIG
jgi:hypothetical protein